MASVFPPYGLMPVEFIDPAAPRDAPAAWNEAFDYAAWLGAVANVLSSTLWPIYVPGLGWQGSAAQQMKALTLADFELLRAMRKVMDSAPGDWTNDKHKAFFQVEDGQQKPQNLHTTLDLYLKPLGPTPLNDAMVKGYLGGLVDTSGLIDLHLKAHFQRPRALQMAFILGAKDFDYMLAGTAASPSLISGHCFQSSLGGLAAFRMASTSQASQAVLDRLAQHTVDVGDRRVFAGVHYPSDNISSWITTLLAHPFTLGDPASRDWYWDAVTTRSAVYRELSRVGEQETGPYARAWTLLHELARSDAATIIDRLELG